MQAGGRSSSDLDNASDHNVQTPVAVRGQLVRRLSRHHTVKWCVFAANELDSPGLLHLLENARCQRFDVVVLSIGANVATGLCRPLQWARWQTRLAEVIDTRFAPSFLVHAAVPPMHACVARPKPLLRFMGHWAEQMNQSLAGLLIEQVGRTMHWHPETITSAGMSTDGIHPSPEGYAAWAGGLSQRVLFTQAAFARPGNGYGPASGGGFDSRGALRRLVGPLPASFGRGGKGWRPVRRRTV